MPFGLIQIEQERSDLWKAEVEAGSGLGSVRRLMVHASTFEDVMAKVAETYREMVPVPKPKADAVEITGHRERLSANRYLADGGTPSLGTAAEPADAQAAPEASEAGEIGTGDQAGSAEDLALHIDGPSSPVPQPSDYDALAFLRPSEADAIARSEMGAAKQRAADRARLTVSREITDGGSISFAPPPDGVYAKEIDASEIGNREPIKRGRGRPPKVA